jgi:peptidyl-prolyl cis-trans isomerase D
MTAATRGFAQVTELMLQQIRDHLTGWVAALIFAPLILAFALWGIQNYHVGGRNYAAKVNGEEISIDEVRNAVRNRLAMFERMSPNGLTPEQEAMIRSDVVDGFVQREVLNQRARKQGYRVSDAAVIKSVHEIPQFQADGKFDYASYERLLSLQGYTPTSFEGSLRSDLGVQQLESGIERSSFATPDELRRRIELDNEQREIAYIVFSATAQAGDIQVSDADIQARYEARKAELVTPETVSIQYVELRADALASEVQVSESDVHDQYEAEVASGRFQKPEEREARHILLKVEGQDESAVRAKAEALVARARAGEDFAKLASENSQDDSTAKDGGELGWITRDMMVTSFSDALWSMQPNTISDPVRSDFGFHIIELEGIRGGETQSYEEVHDALLEELKQKQADSLYYDRAEKLGQRAFEARDSLDAVAQETGLQLQRVDGVTRQKGDGIAGDAAVRAAAFSADVLDGGENSDVIELGEGRAVVLRVVDRKPEAQQPLEEVRGELEAQLRDEAAKAQAEKVAAEALTQLASGTTLEALATEHKGQYHAAGFVGRKGAPPELIKAVFAAPKPSEGKPYEGQVALANGDRAVFVLTAVHPGTLAATSDDDRKKLAQQLTRENGSADFAAYLSELQSRASVVMSQEQLSQLDQQ